MSQDLVVVIVVETAVCTSVVHSVLSGLSTRYSSREPAIKLGFFDLAALRTGPRIGVGVREVEQHRLDHAPSASRRPAAANVVVINWNVGFDWPP